MDANSRSGSRETVATKTKAKTNTRTLTPTQRERKRAADRKAHRNSREKTKNYIAHLERLLEATTSENESSTSNFLRRLNHDFNEIDRLKKSLATICEIAQAALGDASTSARTDANRSFDSSPDDSARNGRLQLHGDRDRDGDGDEEKDENRGGHGAGAGHGDWDKHGDKDGDGEESGDGDGAGHGDGHGPGSGQGHGIPPAELAAPELSDTPLSGLNPMDLTVPDDFFNIPHYNSTATAASWERNAPMELVDYYHPPRSIWTSLGNFTSSALQSPVAATAQTTVAPDLARDTDIIVRAVIYGWDTTAAEHWLDITWQTLRQTDQQLLSGYYGPTERLAILYVMRLQLHHLITGEYLPETPSFLRARPSQKLINHPPHAAYYVWPGFREHLLVWPDRYSSDNMLEHLRSHFRFLWPHGPQDLYVLDRYSGTYTFSADFYRRVKDIRCWTVQTDFFALYPELQNEIPVFKSGPQIFPRGSTNLALSLPANLYSSEDITTAQSDTPPHGGNYLPTRPPYSLYDVESWQEYTSVEQE